MAILPRASATATTVLSSQLLSTAFRRNVTPTARFFNSHPLKGAIAHPITAHGPPPKAPAPAPEFGNKQKQPQDQEQQQQAESGSASGSQDQLQEKQQQQDADVNKAGDAGGKETSAAPLKPSGLRKRFWKLVDVRKKQGMHDHNGMNFWLGSPNSFICSEEEYQVYLDSRPVRTPTKDVLAIPPTKPQLAHAIALEWDVMTSAQQALKHHHIPLTSLTARAANIAQEDTQGETLTRDQILKTTIRYLDTDTILCWVPETNAYSPPDVEMYENGVKKQESLRDVQVRVAKDVIAYLSTKVWPGIEIKPILDENSILPAAQPQATKDIIRSWIYNLEAHDLAGFERGVLGSKSLLIAARLVAEWSENMRYAQRVEQRKFGIEEATEAASLEVRWQTDNWGEVEDTHDVDREDVKRQLGSVVVLVSGETR